MMKLFILLVFFLSADAFSNTETDTPYRNITQAVLDNGLKIIVKIDRRAPVFISQLWYRVGASDESRPTTGVSHMLEHMMFKGTQAYKAGEFSRIIARNGGEENASTSKDFTAYYQKMHKSKLELALKMEADRMRRLTFSDDELTKERQVVIEERRMRIEDKPNIKAYENLRQISFDAAGAYHSPVIGFEKDIESYRLDDLRFWYEKYYAPNNATLVVVGDVEADEVIRLAKRYFGGYALNPDIQISNRKSIPLKGHSRVLKLKAELPFYALSFSAPSLKTTSNEQQAYALEMLAYVLDNGLSKALIRQQHIASNIDVGYFLYDKYDTFFILNFIPANGVSNDTVLTAIKAQVAELIKYPNLIQGELERTKAQLEADFVFEQDKIATQSYYLGLLSTVGLGVDTMFNYVDNMNAVNAIDVANVAKKYLLFNQANTVELVPQGAK